MVQKTQKVSLLDNEKWAPAVTSKRNDLFDPAAIVFDHDLQK